MDVPDARRDALTSSVPDVPGVCIGWRSWELVDTPAGKRLASPVLANVVWPPGSALAARCTAPRDGDHDTVPEPSCSCGLYAVRDPTGVVGCADDGVVGCVALWGRVVKGEWGWRASYGFPLLLLCSPRVYADVGRGLSETYGVPVFSFPPGPESLTWIEDAHVRELAAAVRRHAGVPGAALGQRVAELTDAVATAMQPEVRDPTVPTWRRWWAWIIGVGCRILDAALVLAALASVLLTAAVVPPASSRSIPKVTTVVDTVPGWAVALGWTSAFLLAAVRQCLIAPSLRSVRRRSRLSYWEPAVPAWMTIWIFFLVFAMSWVALLVSRESMVPSVTLPTSVTNCRDVFDGGRRTVCDQSWSFAGKTFRHDVSPSWFSDPSHVTVLVADPGFEVVGVGLYTGVAWAALALFVVVEFAPRMIRYEAPRAAFHGTARPLGTSYVKVSTAEVWLAAHGLLSPTRRDRISRRSWP
jgi:hypothetical protein